MMMMPPMYPPMGAPPGMGAQPGFGQPGMPGTYGGVTGMGGTHDPNTPLECKCSGDTKEIDGKMQGGDTCNSLWENKAWCYVTRRSMCGDIKLSSENIPWSYRACSNGGLATPCVCLGAENQQHEGANCNSGLHKNKAWCYVLKTAVCKHLRPSQNKPDLMWSFSPCKAVSTETAVGDFKVSAKDRPSDNESRFPGYYSRLQRRWAPSDPFPSYLFEH